MWLNKVEDDTRHYDKAFQTHLDTQLSEVIPRKVWTPLKVVFTID